MKMLASIFGTAVVLRNAMYDRGLFKARKLQGPVVSVGNLSVGGSGKTPFVIMLGRLLLARGVRFDILSRGYGRHNHRIAIVDPTGSPKEFGDEPLLISQKLTVPVIVGRDRYQAGLYSESKFGPRLHLLDDGFQHRRLVRDFDIVLLAPEDLSDCLLPAGRLREPLTSLHRAHAVVITNKSAASFSVDGKPIWQVRRGIAPANVPGRPIVFCGIARPKNFVAQLLNAGIKPVAEAFFRDHHSYCDRDIQHLRKLRDQHHANGFVTTEKDAINIGQFRAAIDPLAIVPATMELLDPDNAVDTMLRAIHECGRQP